MAMDTVTYPDARVAGFIQQHFVPVKVMVKEDAATAEQYGVTWTPNVIVADAEKGAVHYRVEGFLPAEDFIARLSLGAGRYWLDRGEQAKAIERFQEVAERHKGSDAAAEALYWLGVANYKQSKDPAQLRPSWQKLIETYPNSEWAKRANVPKK